MTGQVELTGQEDETWRGVDEGWGRLAVEFATLSEPANCREYAALHHRLGVGAGDELLDVACGAGLAVELAGARGARCAGIDASPRLIRVARDRSPEADLRVGDMHALPWKDEVFDVVTSFRGIWGTTPEAVAEVVRVLKPGGRMGFTVWGHIKASPGAWALSPFALASTTKVANQASMVALGRPGAGEELCARSGLIDIERVEIPFAWEFADPEAYARALASTGPAYEAIQSVGEDTFRQHAVEVAQGRIREGLPLRAVIKVVGFVARKPVRASTPGASSGFLAVPKASEAVQQLYDEDVDDVGYVMNVSRLWAHAPDAQRALFALVDQARQLGSLSLRQRGVLVSACASTLGDAYCSLAWGTKLAAEGGDELAGRVIRGVDDGLEPAEVALARWARRVTQDPNATSAADVDALRTAGFDDTQIFAITLYVAMRIAFSTVNDALGVLPDGQLSQTTPAAVLEAVTFGRPLGAVPPSDPTPGTGGTPGSD